MDKIKKTCKQYGTIKDDRLSLSGELSDLLAELEQEFGIDTIRMEKGDALSVRTKAAQRIIYIKFPKNAKLFGDNFTRVNKLFYRRNSIDYTGGRIKYLTTHPSNNKYIKNLDYKYYCVERIYPMNHEWPENKKIYVRNYANDEDLQYPNIVFERYNYRGVAPLHPENIKIYCCDYHNVDHVLALNPRRLYVRNTIPDWSVLYDLNIKLLKIDDVLSVEVVKQLVDNPHIKSLELTYKGDEEIDISHNTSLTNVFISRRLGQGRMEYYYYHDIVERNKNLQKCKSVKSARNV